MSWTDKIETGTYSFYVLANYKETKIQTALITLNISSEQSENTGNLNCAIKDALYDENTISQELLDFVKYVNFSLDYTENDYGTDKDGKKGEILINNIIIGYKNSKNTFTVSNSDTKKAISNAINNDSGVTARFSNNLYENVKSNFLMVLIEPSVYGQCIKDYVKTTSYSLNAEWIAMLVVSSICTFIGFVGLGIIVYNVISNKKSNISSCKKIFSWAVIVVSFCALILMIFLAGKQIACDLSNKLDKIEKFNNWDKHADDSDEFYTKICDDMMYFLPNDGSKEAAEKCKEKFNNLSISDAKAKKSFYEQCFIKPDDYDTNLKKYADTPYEQRQKSLDHIKQAFEQIQDIVATFVLFMIGCVICAVLLFVSLYIVIKSYKVAENNPGYVEVKEIRNTIDEAEAKDKRTWKDLDKNTKTEIQHQAINERIIGEDTAFKIRKPIFDKALKDKDVIFVNLSVEKPPKQSEYQSVGKVGNSPFTLYRRRTYEFFDNIIYLLGDIKPIKFYDFYHG